MDAEINNLKDNINNLEIVNKDFKDKINYLFKIDNLEGRIYNLETEPKYNDEVMTQRFESIENNNYLERINTLTNRINSIEQLTAIITDLSYRISELEKRQDLTERVSGLEVAFASLKST
jgi:5'-deoxynucleotidase YfbR-like HD superfamily hydrolase